MPRSQHTKNAAPEADGRVLRSLNSRQKIIEASIALVHEGVLVPSAQDVAARAGVGLRSVFRHYSDMESLFNMINVEITRRHIHRFQPEDIPKQAGVGERLDYLINLRLDIYRQERNIFLTTLVQQWRYPVLQDNYRQLLTHLDAHAHQVLPEIKRLSAAERLGLFSLLSFENWQTLTDHRELSALRARRAISQACKRFLP